ncbi:GerAB/ArcD/ProY family transporter [Salipaludibacillus daqingensis]|uniref:GerAB/ArcD/ProY family transporter n=1 Tax=Salipaludibacillus daqingensis TaxID=3041001 RepID=UPI00247395F7|nr:GerAB/ArcD/ProY family transporter [Salipaludibacillus daqingensis]
MNTKTNFSTIDFTILTYMLQSGITFFVLPRLMAENFGYNGWLAIPVISIVLLGQIILLGHVCKKMKRTSPLDRIDKVMPKVLRYPIYIFLAGTWAVLGCSVGANYFQIIQMMSFPNTPQYIFKGILAVIAFFILVSGFEGFVKGTTVFFFLTIWTLFSSFVVLKDFQFDQLTPFIFAGDTNFINGSFEVLKAFLGFELFIIFSSYIQKDINITKAITLGHLFTTVVYTFVTFIAFGFFSFQQLLDIEYPVIQMLDYVKVPFLERIDNLIFSFFLMKVVVTVTAYYWAAKEVLQQIFININESLLIFIIVTGNFLLGFMMETAREIETVVNIFSKLAFGISIVLPIFLLLIMKRSKNQTNEVKDHD